MVSLLVLFSYLCYFFSNSDNYTVRKFKWWHYGLALWEEIFDQFPLFDFTSHRALQYCHQSNTAKCAKTCLTVYGCLLWAGTRRRRWTWLTAGWVSPSCSPPRRSSTPTWTRWAWWPTFHSSPMLRSVLRGRTYEVVYDQRLRFPYAKEWSNMTCFATPYRYMITVGQMWPTSTVLLLYTKEGQIWPTYYNAKILW